MITWWHFHKHSWEFLKIVELPVDWGSLRRTWSSIYPLIHLSLYVSSGIIKYILCNRPVTIVPMSSSIWQLTWERDYGNPHLQLACGKHGWSHPELTSVESPTMQCQDFNLSDPMQPLVECGRITWNSRTSSWWCFKKPPQNQLLIDRNPVAHAYWGVLFLVCLENHQQEKQCLFSYVIFHGSC